MQITIDTTKPLPEVSDQVLQAMLAIQEQYGWDSMAQTLENGLMKMTLLDFSGKNDGCMGRLKRMSRALNPPDQ